MTLDLRTAATDYLVDRRARGWRLADHDYLITGFLDGLEARGLTKITITDALAFAQEPAEITLCWQARRLTVIRHLAAHIHSLDPAAADLIPPHLITDKVTRRIPYLYSNEQVAQLMSMTSILRPPLMAASTHTLIGLLAATGLRSGEAVALDVDDLDIDEGVLAVTGKYGKQRIIPLHRTTVEALSAYLGVRATKSGPIGPLLIGCKGGRLNANLARQAFRVLVDTCQLSARPGGSVPRLHDFRHTFAVDSLIDALRQGTDVDARIAVLVSYLGHVEPANTYWYLTASPELMAMVSERMAAYQGRWS